MNLTWTEIFIALVGTYLCIAVYVKWVYNHWERLKIPYLTPSIFRLGNFEPLWNMKTSFHLQMETMYKQIRAKGYRHMGIFSSLRPVYVPVDLDILKSILIKDFQHFVDRGVYYNEKSDPLSAHLFRIEGEKWKRLRNKLSPTFTSGRMKSMFQVVLDCGDGLEKEVDKLCRIKDAVNIKEMAALFTTNVIGTCAFGLDCNCFENPKNDFRVNTSRFFDGDFESVLRFYASSSFPGICKLFGIRFFPKQTTDFFSVLMSNVIEYRQKANLKRNDFIKLLLDINKNATSVESAITFEEMVAQSVVFFLAGFETSSSTMTYAFYEMAQHQDIQDKVREEIHRVMENHGGKLTYDAIMEMTYMQQVFDETLRKYPILATLDRVVTKDYQLPGEDILLKKGTKVFISLKGIHNDPKYYPDPDKFDPERFSQENKVNRHPCAYMPFGEGPRICIGMRFGIMQAKIGMSILLKNYKYSISPKSPTIEFSNTAVLLQPNSGVYLDIEKVN